MILSGKEIQKHIGKEIKIEPYNEKQLNPNSYNLKLHNEILVYDEDVLDMKKENKYQKFIIPPEGMILFPGKLYLARTVEYTETLNHVPMLEGRCFAKDTKILMWDKQFKNIQDIKVNDLVFGIDGKPKKVKNIHSGIGQLYNIHQSNGMDYIVNGKHLLHLYCNFTTCNRFIQGETYDISVEEYINLANYNKEHLKGYRLPVEYYNTDELKLDPYLLGVWLGDGDNKGGRFTVNNESTEIFDYIKTLYPNSNFYNYKEKAKTITLTKHGGHYIRKDRNFDDGLKYYNLLHNKHIPIEYMKSSIDVRLNVLAGILDTDGTPNHTCWEVLTVYPALAKDIMELAESCGFTCSYAIRDRRDLGWSIAYRINIKGDVKKIPNKVMRKVKRLNYNKMQDKTMSTISVQPLHVGEYYGFELEGDSPTDKLFYLEDFTVAHNSSVGRLGLYIHVTAGFGDVGFKGYWTLELQCVQPIRIYADTEICQIYYHSIEGEYEEYKSGKYQGNKGVQPSLLYKDFEGEKKCSKCICCNTEEMWCEQDNSKTYEDYAKQCKCYEEAEE